jgi:tol-pal system protein YbgF
MKRWAILLASASWLVGGCYGAKVFRQPVTVEESARDLEAVRQQQGAMEARLEALEKRAAEQAELLRGLKADSYARWSEFDDRLGAIDAKLRDALGHRESYARSPSIWSAEPPGAGRTEAAPPAPPAEGTAPGATGSVGVAAGAADTTAALPSPTSETEAKRIYDQAYKDLTRGNYSLAILGFREFLQRSPASDLADNAQYWMGECYYAQRDFSAAIQEFLRVPERWPRGDKVPGALLKTGYSYVQLDDRASARKFLNQVVEQFPDTEEAVNAKNKLRSVN